VYGKLTDFKDVSFAVEVFKFAHEMQLDYLANELIKFIRVNVKPSEVFATYDFFKKMDSSAGLKVCSEVNILPKTLIYLPLLIIK
jgi:hypothetical protein